MLKVPAIQMVPIGANTRMELGARLFADWLNFAQHEIPNTQTRRRRWEGQNTRTDCLYQRQKICRFISQSVLIFKFKQTNTEHIQSKLCRGFAYGENFPYIYQQ